MSFEQICDDDYVISDSRSKGYYCRQIGHFKSIDEGARKIATQMQSDQFWPNVWYVNDHGNLSRIILQIIGKQGRFVTWRFEGEENP